LFEAKIKPITAQLKMEYGVDHIFKKTKWDITKLKGEAVVEQKKHTKLQYVH